MNGKFSSQQFIAPDVKNFFYEQALIYLLNKRDNRNGKGIELHYTNLDIQNYLRSEDIEITNQE